MYSYENVQTRTVVKKKRYFTWQIILKLDPRISGSEFQDAFAREERTRISRTNFKNFLETRGPRAPSYRAQITGIATKQKPKLKIINFGTPKILQSTLNINIIYIRFCWVLDTQAMGRELKATSAFGRCGSRLLVGICSAIWSCVYYR